MAGGWPRGPTKCGTRTMLVKWFKEKAPRYRVIPWFSLGTDLLIEGRGLLVGVEIALVPGVEDVEALAEVKKLIEKEWEEKPAALIMYVSSSIVPPDVAELASSKGIRIVKSPEELEQLLDEISSQFSP